MKSMTIAMMGATCLAASPAYAQALPERIDFDPATVSSAFLDPAIDPGDDFFGYANNGLLDTLEIPGNLPATGLGIQSFLDQQERVKGLFADVVAQDAAAGTVARKVADSYLALSNVEAIDAAGLAPLEPWFARIDAVETMDDLARLWADAAYPGAIGHSLIENFDDPDRHIMSMSFGTYLLDDTDNYLVDNERNRALQAYARTYAKDVFEALGMDGAEARADRILALETAMAHADWSRTLSRKILFMWRPVTQAQAQALTGSFPLSTYLEAAGIPSDQDINLLGLPPTPEALAKETLSPEEYAQSRRGYPTFMRLVADTPIEVWKDWTKLHFVDRYFVELPASLRVPTERFRMVEKGGNPAPFPRPLVVGRLLDLRVGEGLGQVYVDRYFSPEAKALATDMIENVRAAMKLNLEELDWMGEETRAKALEKLAAITPKVGYPDKFETYEGVETAADTPLANAIAFRQWSQRDALARLAKPVDKTRWSMTPQTINAYYSGTANEIVFPAGFMQPPMFGVDRDPAANYGALGAVIGHEIGHGFDERGSRFDAKGRLRNWWTEEDRERFEAQANRLIAQYDTHCPYEDACVNGALTLGENIGDLGGLAIAYRAYHLSLGGKEAPVINGLTGDQRFFIAHAQNWGSKFREGAVRKQMESDEHSPATARVNEVVRNFDPWYAAFDVTPGDALYLPPEERVRIWN